MKANYILLLTLCWILILVGCASPSSDLEVNVTPKTGLDPKGPSTLKNTSNLNEKTDELRSVVDSNKVDLVKKDKDQVGGSKEGVQNNELNEKNSGEKKVVVSKEDHIEEKDKGGKKEKSGEGSESKEVTKEVPASLPPVRKEGSRGEECDASNSCKDDNSTLVACLRVPGNDDSPDLSLLVQNKGNGPLSITISAPDFVQLEKTIIKLPGKENIKVRVSISDSGTDSLIVLTAGNGNCSLDFRDLISLNFGKETDYMNVVKRTPFGAFIVFAALLVSASAWTCVILKRRYLAGNDSKYQKLDMELPVSGGGKVESDINDGWDNSWDDNWDDEEAPKTPSMPVTPSVSSKGLASRRFNKDSWKD